jgi:hypothetical protein
MTDTELAGAVKAYEQHHAALLAKPGHFMGGWHDPEQGKSYLDVSTVLPTARKARRVAIKSDQIAYFDFQTGTSVDVSQPIKKFNPNHDDHGRFATGVGTNKGTPGIGEPSSTITAIAPSVRHYGHSIPNDSDVKQADAYEAMVHNPSDPRVQASYASFEKTLKDQWNILHAHGITYHPQVGPEGYKNSQEMIHDLNSGHLSVFLTEGGGDLPSDHPMMKSMLGQGLTGLDKGELGPKPVLNDVFRAVHDTLGHGVSGGSFGVKGERAAWITHRSTFPTEALPALWNETRGQAAWTNAGPDMRNAAGELLKKGEPGYLALPDRPFAEQKAGFAEGADF